MKLSTRLALILLTLVFTVGLTYASVELPALASRLLMEHLDTPGFDPTYHQEETEAFIGGHHLRTIGCVGLVLTIVLIGFGLGAERRGLAAAGALLFFLPVFGHFAASMFFLAGLAILRVIWLPILEISHEVMALGDVVYLPYAAVVWPLVNLGWDIRDQLPWPVMGLGIAIFTASTLTWMKARFEGRGVADSWLYRISRHPQYLGWIVWSYGVYLLLLQNRYPKRSWGISANLPWLISTIAIIGVAMMEELNMRQKHGEEYEAYRRSAPFLFPVPGFIERLFALPFRLLFRKERPDRRREVVTVLLLYTVLFIGASSLFYGSGMERMTAVLRSGEAQREHLSALVQEIRAEENWRRQSSLTHSLGAYGEEGVPYLIDLLQDDDPELREFATETLRDHPAEAALEALTNNVASVHVDVRWKTGEALGALGTPDALAALNPLLGDSIHYIRMTAVQALAAAGREEILPIAIEMTRSESTRERADGVGLLGALGSDGGLEAVVDCLDDEEAWVRQEAVIALLRIGSPDAVPALEQVLDDEDREVRIYAAETVKRLGRL